MGLSQFVVNKLSLQITTIKSHSSNKTGMNQPQNNRSSPFCKRMAQYFVVFKEFLFGLFSYLDFYFLPGLYKISLILALLTASMWREKHMPLFVHRITSHAPSTSQPPHHVNANITLLHNFVNMCIKIQIGVQINAQ